jgi:hypothetical protein
MSDLNEFLREARHEVSMKKFEEDAEAGLISDYEYGSRLRLVGNPAKPLAVCVGFRTHEGWRRFCETMPTEPPEIREFEQTADGWIEIQ